MRSADVYVKRTVVYEHEMSEIDFDLADQFGLDSESDGRIVFIGESDDGRGKTEAAVSAFKKMIEDAGATRNSRK
jgi:hypothetical protein